eukprot:403376863
MRSYDAKFAQFSPPFQQTQLLNVMIASLQFINLVMEENQRTQIFKFNQIINLLIGSLIRKLNDGRWVHFWCIKWIPEIQSQGDIELKQMIGYPNIKRFGLQCYLCQKKSDYSACLDCMFPQCFKKFHIRCAIDVGLIQSDPQMEDFRNPQNPQQYGIFCSEHRSTAKKAIKKTGFYSVVKQDKILHPQTFVQAPQIYKSHNPTFGNDQGINTTAQNQRYFPPSFTNRQQHNINQNYPTAFSYKQQQIDEKSIQVINIDDEDDQNFNTTTSNYPQLKTYNNKYSWQLEMNRPQLNYSKQPEGFLVNQQQNIS